MADGIDVKLEALARATLAGNPYFATGLAARAGLPVPRRGPFGTPENAKTFYIETFGCQMNVHDSEKVAGVLLGRGYRQVERPEEADLLLYNTCSIREKAAQKVFSRLGQAKSSFGSAKKIGVLGCVAQQEGEAIFERAPRVS
jgi:hypothetical protein